MTEKADTLEPYRPSLEGTSPYHLHGKLPVLQKAIVARYSCSCKGKCYTRIRLPEFSLGRGSMSSSLPSV